MEVFVLSKLFYLNTLCLCDLSKLTFKFSKIIKQYDHPCDKMISLEANRKIELKPRLKHFCYKKCYIEFVLFHNISALPPCVLLAHRYREKRILPHGAKTQRRQIYSHSGTKCAVRSHVILRLNRRQTPAFTRRPLCQPRPFPG